jgi:hypothetical protein
MIGWEGGMHVMDSDMQITHEMRKGAVIFSLCFPLLLNTVDT